MIYTETVYLSDTYKNAVYSTFLTAWNATKAGDDIHKALISFSLNADEDKERTRACQLGVYFPSFLSRVLEGEFQHKYTYVPLKQWVKANKKR